MSAKCAASERLYHAHDQCKKARAHKRACALEEELTACTFQPQVNQRPLQKQYVPIHERAGLLVRDKAAKLSRCAM